jgi:DNA primase
MVINNIEFNTDLETVLVELRNQLFVNNILLLQKMKPTSTHVMVQCPYHAGGHERRPSAGIRKEDGIFHCFACGEIHSLQEVISYCFGHTDDIVGSFGWQWLIRNFTTVQYENRKDIRLDFGRDFTKSKKNYVSEDELDKYRYYHPYILNRGISKKIVNLFDVGYDKTSQTCTFPNLDKEGNCLFVARRSVKTKFFQYPSNVQKEVYGIYQLYQLDPFPSEVYITESMIDCLYLWTFNKYACALNGLGNSIQFEQLNNMPCRKFILATDSDRAGIQARKRLRDNIKNKLITEVILPNGRKDINECSPDEIENLIEVFN